MARDRDDRVRRNSPLESNIRVDRDIEDRIRAYQTRTPQEIGTRIRELDREWGMERILELNTAVFALVGAVLSAFFGRWWRLSRAL